ncbi:hypothetical protein ACP4OV_012057 [Aristida adscensionis]
MEQHLGNATSTTSFHQPSDLWKSPRGTVLRIEALALVAIAFTFLLATMGSCRRWSNRWIIQRGYLAANVISLSLGTYSIGLMQSSPVKSEMYPIWAVSFLILFGCVDSITTYNGLDYKSPLLKMIFQLCLYCAYVLLMSISIIFSDVGNIAIGILTVITLIKGLHRSLALVLQRILRGVRSYRSPTSEVSDILKSSADPDENSCLSRGLSLDEGLYLDGQNFASILLDLYTCDIRSSFKDMGELWSDISVCYDPCVAFSLSHILREHFVRWDNDPMKRDDFEFCGFRSIDYKRTLKWIEIELAFLYEVFYTSNAFLHYYQARTACFWAFASFLGICFVVVATIPGTRTSRQVTSPGRDARTIIVDTTAADLILTLVVLVSLALLQLVQLIRCWTSNWARVAFACEYADYCNERRWKRKLENDIEEGRTAVVENGEAASHNPQFASASSSSITMKKKKRSNRLVIWLWWMRLKAFVVTRINWSERYLWQDKLGQYSVVEGSSRKECKLFSSCVSSKGSPRSDIMKMHSLRWVKFLEMIGLPYIRHVLREFWHSGANKGATIRLHDDVKASIADFLCGIKSRSTGKVWSSLFVENGIDLKDLPYHHTIGREKAVQFTSCVMKWHIATWYCELADQEQQQEKQDILRREHAEAGGGGGEEKEVNHRRVAIALSKYCAYLVVSVPELLPGPTGSIKVSYNCALRHARRAVDGAEDKLKAAHSEPKDDDERRFRERHNKFWQGVVLGQQLLGKRPSQNSMSCSDPWKLLALFWVQALVYAAPYGSVEAHMEHLAQGGEFITHIWALLFHVGVTEWKPADKKEEKEMMEHILGRTTEIIEREQKGEEDSDGCGHDISSGNLHGIEECQPA